MPFKKGDPNIFKGGRTGPNKSTKLMKECFAHLVEQNLPKMNELLDRVAEDNPEKALDLIIKLSERFVPALARTELTGSDGSDIFESIRFSFGPPIDSDKRIQNTDDGEVPDISKL